MIPCLCSFLFSSCTAHHKTAVIPVDIPMRWEPRTNQSNGLCLLIFLQPLGRALKNQNAAPTTPPCFSRWLRSSSLLFKSSYPQLLLRGNCHVKQKRQWTACLPVDIPMGWEPRTNKSPTGAFVAPPAVGPYGLRLLIFPQPLGRALKNQNAARATPPCFCRRQRSSSLLFKSSYPLLQLKREYTVK